MYLNTRHQLKTIKQTVQKSYCRYTSYTLTYSLSSPILPCQLVPIHQFGILGISYLPRLQHNTLWALRPVSTTWKSHKTVFMPCCKTFENLYSSCNVNECCKTFTFTQCKKILKLIHFHTFKNSHKQYWNQFIFLLFKSHFQWFEIHFVGPLCPYRARYPRLVGRINSDRASDVCIPVVTRTLAG